MRDERSATGAPEALGQSEAFLTFQERLSRVAGVDRPVLIVGERGTGKELAAKRLHFLSRRWEEPLVELNCAALAPSLIESELFGHEAGAFTGALKRRPGLFEQADGGTVFLDELGNIPLPVQEKILRVVEYGVFQRVGGSEQVRVDVRIIGATNADLPALAREGRFMRDLLDRLSFEVLYVPPLRERREDILVLANHFAMRMAVELNREEPPEFSEAVQAALEAHAWRGNIRELKNVIERAVYCNDNGPISTVIFDPFVDPFGTAPAEPAPPHAAAVVHGVTVAPRMPLDFTAALRAYELTLLRAALHEARYNQRKAARLLGMSYDAFRGLYRKHQGEVSKEV
jgi:psp operon transcriptional activator